GCRRHLCFDIRHIVFLLWFWRGFERPSHVVEERVKHSSYLLFFFSSGTGSSDLPSELGWLARWPTCVQTAPIIRRPHIVRPRRTPITQKRVRLVSKSIPD